ncbi:helix-turn-helix domain containing protein [Luteipulveratus sp. YIM 133132]|uniref:TetR/AcrR family transcriptional regulator n=1 Tax=Luteipulveratus flavus TaxID=3031728 RepID=UPI0023AE9D3B|nr:TetR/AcrR family transcriptional regulator [Luteipulveratus sp. YIM 133132]MDE9366727.1 helix-turn-helix domain containing protein [Luteipulveratus sp. YIM 133132]
MADSAIVESDTARTTRRQANAQRLSRCAQRLADRRGVDGFTMDELATEAGVSRRTLFNYFPSKDDAILGPMPELDPEYAATFRAGGPTGHLVDDMAVLIDNLLQAKSLSREDITVGRRVMEDNPRLMALAHQRFQLFAEQVLGWVREREGDGFDETRARVAVTVLGGLFALTLDTYVTDPQQRPLADLYAIALRHARELLA